MPQIILATDSYSRELGSLPATRLVNFFAESAPTDEDGVVLQSRPGLTSAEDWGSGPIHALMHKPGSFNGDRFAISGLYLFREGTQVGPILGSGPVSWDMSDSALVVTRGTYVYSYQDGDLQSIPFPEGANCTAVTCLDGLFFFVRADTTEFYWNDINEDERTIDSLSFASAELAPDNLLDTRTVLGQLILIGTDTIETWFPSTNPNLPVTRMDQRMFTVGARAAGCVAQLGDMIMFVGGNGKVYRLSAGLDPISNPGIEERVAASESCTTFAFTWNGHAFFCVKLDDETLVFDISTEKWTVFATYGHDNWRPKCALNVGADVYLGDDTDDDIWTFGSTFADDGVNLEGYFTALFGIEGGVQNVGNLEVRGNIGDTQPLSGDDADPQLEMRTSDDAGMTWDDWQATSFGAQGEYRTKAQYRRLGCYDAPGFIAEFRVTDQTPRRISSVWINVPGGGRSR
jgi:hypothetical protein